MKVLWLCNVVPPAIAEQLHIDTTVKEGWLDASLRRLLKSDDIEIGVCMPRNDIDSPYVKAVVNINNRQVSAYSFLEQTQTPWIYDKTLDTVFAKIQEDFKPDLIHIFGTEYPHTLACVKAFNNPERVLIGIQGVMEACTKAYTGGLPDSVVNSSTFRDVLKKDNIAAQQHKFALRAGFEKEALLLAKHVTGRTDFDKKSVLAINNEITYHPMNETLRSEFYSGQWDGSSLDKHVIFVTQADYPLKGFHVMLKSMPLILEKYPDATVCVAGNSITNYSTIKDKIKICTYGKYLRDLMKELGIMDKVNVLGRLSTDKIKEQYLNSSVFVCTSYIENSPNSLGEAMLLGTPAVAPVTGGIPSMATEDETVFYTVGDHKELADKIISLFDDKEKALNLSAKERARALSNHDADANYKRLTEIYREICQ